MKKNRISKAPLFWESSFGRSNKSFRIRRWRSSFQPSNDSAEAFWTLQTNLRMQSFLEFMKLRALYENLDSMEQQFLFDAPGVMRDRLFLDALRAIKTVGFSRDLQERLEICCFIEHKPHYWRPQLLKQWKGNAIYRICLSERPIRKAKKFSGWIRNPSAAGSKRFGTTRPEPGTFEWVTADEIDYFHALTVGEFPGTMGIKILSLTRPRRPKQ